MSPPAEVVVVALAITRKALYKRNIIEFGPTALRATLAFSLCYLAKLQPGDIVVDHMCGGGGVIIEVFINDIVVINI